MTAEEATIEKRLGAEIADRGGLCWKFVSPGLRGVPDRIVMLPGGRLWFVELKAAGGRLSDSQVKRKAQIQEAGQRVVVIRGMGALRDWLKLIDARL